VLEALTLRHGDEQLGGIKAAVGEIHPEIVAEHAEIFRIIRDESTTDIRRAVFFDATEKFEQLRRFEVLEQVTAVNAIALTCELTHLVTPEKLEDVDLEILDAKLFAGSDRLGVTFNTESGDFVFFERTQKKSATGAEIEHFLATGKVRNVTPMKIEHLVVRETELIRIESVGFEKIGVG